MDILIDIQTFKKTLSSGYPKTDTSTDNSKSIFYYHYMYYRKQTVDYVLSRKLFEQSVYRLDEIMRWVRVLDEVCTRRRPGIDTVRQRP